MQTKLLWICAGLGLLVGVLALLLLGVTIWTVVLTVVLLVCPAIILWGVIVTMKGRNRTKRVA
jgi:hypothetical protein